MVKQRFSKKGNKSKLNTRRTIEDAKTKKKLSSQRWLKGHSCVSNPEKRKFREKVSSQYFHQVIPNPLLTESQVIGNFDSESLKDEDILSADIRSLSVYDSEGGSFSTAKTFASGWSKCTNNAFSRWLSKFKMDSYLHKDMLSILSATTDVIKEAGGQQNETEYFATFISTLDNCAAEQYHPLLALLSITMGKVSVGVLKIKFGEIHPKLANILSYANENDNEELLCITVGAMAKLFKVQDVRLLDSETSIQNLVNSMLRCTLHEKTKVRKKCRKSVKSIMIAHVENDSNVMAKFVVSWILDQLSCFPTCGPKTVTDALSLLLVTWDSIIRISAPTVKKLFETILRVMSSGDSSIVRIGLAFFSTVFEKGWDNVNSTSSTLMPGLMSALWEMKPDWRSREILISWLKCFLNGLVRSHDENNASLLSYLPLLMQMISLNWHTSSAHEVSVLVKGYFLHFVNENTDLSILDECCKCISKSLISLPPNPNCLIVLDGLLKAMSRQHFVSSCKEIFLQLIPLKSHIQVNPVLESFVRTFGVEHLWDVIDSDLRQTVLLPLLRENLSQSKIQFWKNNILPLGTKSQENAVRVLAWESFAGFCRDPQDPENFPAEIVGKLIVSNSEARLAILAGLRQFIMWPQCKDIAVKYSPNYLPILCQLYTQQRQKLSEETVQQKLLRLGNGKFDGQADSVASTIKEYLPMCSKSFVEELLEKAISKVKAENVNAGTSTPILDIIDFLVPYNLVPSVQTELVEILRKLLDDSENVKKAYRVLSSLVVSKELDENIKNTIVSLILDKKGAKSNAEAMRIKCMENLLLQDKNLSEKFLPEAILNLLSINGKTKKMAENFVSTYCDTLESNKRSLQSVDCIVQLGVNSSNHFIVASTIHFVGLVHIYLKPEYPDEQILKKVFSLLETNEDQTVSRECLALISLNLTMFKNKMGPYAASIGAIIETQKFPRKEVNKILVRMIKIFGAVGLKAVLGNSEQSNFHVRIKNLQKKLKKNSEKKDKAPKDVDKLNGSDESDDEIEPSFFNTTDSSHLVIKEGIVDFLDPNKITGSLISKPKEKKGEEFQMSSDGKLIIKAEDESQEGENDEDINDALSEPDFLTHKRKRKHGGSVASSIRSKKSGTGSIATQQRPKKKSRSAIKKPKSNK